MAKGKKGFTGLADRSGLAGQTGKGFGGLVQQQVMQEAEQTPADTKEAGIATEQEYAPDAWKYETFSIQISTSEKIKDYTHQQRISGRSTFRYRDALEELLNIAYKTVGPIPERPEEIKAEERSKGRKGSPGRKKIEN
jgi:hypothetical protein